MSISSKILHICFLAFFVLISAVSCQKNSPSWEPNRDFKTQIVVSTTFDTKIQTVVLKGVQDKKTLDGSIADFYYSPGDQSGTMVGEKPLTKFIEDKNGVNIPSDQITLQMVTLYYHLQQLKELEVSATGGSLLSWPRKVGLAVHVLTNDLEIKENNASYNSLTDALYFVPYTSSAFPIPLNPGVIAHEHFHAYFFHQVMKPLVVNGKFRLTQSVRDMSRDEVYQAYLMKMLNEGLADVWGWIYSQDPDFVSLSLMEKGAFRNLEMGKGIQPVASESELKNDVHRIQQADNPDKALVGYAYGRGSGLSRVLKRFADYKRANDGLSENEIKKVMAANVLKLINGIQIRMMNEEALDLDQVLQIWESQFANLSENECNFLKSVTSKPEGLACSKNSSSSLQ